MSLSGSKANPLWYADLGREAQKETVVQTGPCRLPPRHQQGGLLMTSAPDGGDMQILKSGGQIQYAIVIGNSDTGRDERAL